MEDKEILKHLENENLATAKLLNILEKQKDNILLTATEHEIIQMIRIKNLKRNILVENNKGERCY